MKKYLLQAFSLLLTLGVASCSNSEDAPEMTQPVDVLDPNVIEVTCGLPADANLRTRGADAAGLYGDGSEVKYLQYAVYDASGTCIASSDRTNAAVAQFDAATKTFRINLPKPADGDEYDVILWADAFGIGSTESPYSLDEDRYTVYIDYHKAGQLVDRADAFCFAGTYDSAGNFTSNSGYGNASKARTVTLTRPFAQICLLTTPEDLAAHPEYTSTVVRFNYNKPYLSDLPNGLSTCPPPTIDWMNGSVWFEQGTEEALKDSFMAVMPSKDVTYTYNGKVYNYLAVIYVPSYTLSSSHPNCDGYIELPVELDFCAANDPLNVINSKTIEELSVNANQRMMVFPASTSNGLLTAEGALSIKVSPGFTNTVVND